MDKIRLVGEAGFGGIELWLNDVWEYVARGGEVSDLEKASCGPGLNRTLGHCDATMG